MKKLIHIKIFSYAGYYVVTSSIFSEIPNSFSLYQNFPNPLNPKTVIKYEILKSDFLILTIYDALGKVVATLVNELQQPGAYRVEWPACRTESGRDGSNAPEQLRNSPAYRAESGRRAGYPGGVYFYKLRTSGYKQARKMVSLK